MHYCLCIHLERLSVFDLFPSRQKCADFDCGDCRLLWAKCEQPALGGCGFADGDAADDDSIFIPAKVLYKRIISRSAKRLAEISRGKEDMND